MQNKRGLIGLGAVVAVMLGVVIYCMCFGNRYVVIFDTDGGTEIAKQWIKAGDKVEKPEDPKKEGFEFVEWQWDGKTFDFDSKVYGNINLKAIWDKVEEEVIKKYTVEFNSAGGSKVENQRVKDGDKAIKPTNPVKDGYEFLGWYNKEDKYNFDSKVTSDLTLTAKWKKKSSSNGGNSNNGGNNSSALSSDLKVGDRVRIVGSYAESSTALKARHSKAIGWKRVILKIYEGREYPYRVGNSSGTTGFFKAESLEKIN